MKKVLLFLLLSVLTIGAWAQTSPYTGVAVGDIEDGKSYYLYNVDFGTWLGDNKRNQVYGWTSHAELGSHGRDIKFIQVEGGWKLDPKLGHNHSINSSNLYMDTDDAATTWTITALNNGISNAVKIKCGDKGLSANNSGDMDEAKGDLYNNWQIVSRNERLAKAIELGTSANPVDISGLVFNGTFPVADDYHNGTVWKGNWGSNAIGYNDNTAWNRVWELWALDNREVYQDIPVPNGKYRVGGRAIYVSTGGSGMNADRYNEYIANPADNTKGYIFANDGQTPMVNAYSLVSNESVSGQKTKNLGNGKYVMDGVGQMCAVLGRDAACEVETFDITVTDGNIRIGFKTVGAGGSGWVILSKFSLYCLGGLSLQEICQLENTDNDATFQDAIDNATDENLRIARKIHAADKQENVFSKETTPENNKYYYLYNVGQKRFFCGGDSWGTHAAVGFPGIKVLLCDQDGSSFRIDTRLQNGTNEHYLNYNSYCDTNTSDKWTFSRNTDGTYAIARSNDNSLLLGYTTGTFCRVDSDRSDTDNSNNKWILVTEEERDALISAASPTNPVDVSYKIKMPNFNQREYVIDGGWQKTDSNPNGAWTVESSGTGARGIWGRGAEHPDFVFESWNDATLDLNQEIADLEPGIYKVSVQGYYRHGNREQQVKDFDNAAVKADGAYLYANGLLNKTQYLVPITNELNKAPGEGWESAIGRFPDACTGAATYFEYGLYKNELEVVVGLDRTLKIGIVKTQNNMANDWVVVDNFRLTYLGWDCELKEDADNSGINRDAYVVKLDRTLKADKWNTFCVPFPMTAAQIEDQLGADAEVKELTGATKNGDNYTMTFSDATSIEADKPYMVKVTSDVSSIELNEVNGIAVNTTGTPAVSVDVSETTDEITFHGVYTSGSAPLNSFIIYDNVFYNVNSDVALKAFRGYITIAGSNDVKALNFTFDDDDATSIQTIDNGQQTTDGAIYNVAGQRLNKMQKGINIVNGKKILR